MTAHSELTKKVVGHNGAAHTESSVRAKIVVNLQRVALPFAWLLLIIGFGIHSPKTFLTAANFQTMFGSQAVLLVLTLALIIPLTAGDYDLSVASVMGLSAMLVAVLNVRHGWPVGVVILVALLVGVVVGLANGFIMIFFGIDSLIVTLGMGTLLSGMTLWISNSETISGVSQGLVDAVTTYRIFGISLAFYYGLLVCVIMWYVFEFTAVGRRLLFVGRGRSVARLSGVKVNRVRITSLVVASSLASLAGIFYAGTTGGADPSSSATFLLPAFAAAFLGATSIMPGKFNPWGTLLAVYFLVTGITGLQLLGVPSFVQQLFYGGALLTAVALSQLTRGRVPLEAN
ncbi:MAG TPA: ABC transporter permease [Jatrophihabitans sp.]|jgi:ribose transport system permease protein